MQQQVQTFSNQIVLDQHYNQPGLFIVEESGENIFNPKQRQHFKIYWLERKLNLLKRIKYAIILIITGRYPINQQTIDHHQAERLSQFLKQHITLYKIRTE